MRILKIWTLMLLVVVLSVSVSACGWFGPKAEIVGLDTYESWPGFDYTITVKCTVLNNGKSGQVEVFAELENGGYWKKSKKVYIEARERVTVEIAFPEATLLVQGLAGYHYRAWAKP